jgi:hypothetical protein
MYLYASDKYVFGLIITEHYCIQINIDKQI